MFEKTDFYKTSDKQCLFLTLHDAVVFAQRCIQIGVSQRQVAFFKLLLLSPLQLYKLQCFPFLQVHSHFVFLEAGISELHIGERCDTL